MPNNSSSARCPIGAAFLASPLHIPVHLIGLCLIPFLVGPSALALTRARRRFRTQGSAVALLTSALVSAGVAGLGTLPVQALTSGLVFDGPCGLQTQALLCFAALTPATLGLVVFLMAYSLLALERFYIIQLIAKANGLRVVFWIGWAEWIGRRLGVSSGVLVYLTWLWGLLVVGNNLLIFDITQPNRLIPICAMPNYKPAAYLPGLLCKTVLELGAIYAVVRLQTVSYNASAEPLNPAEMRSKTQSEALLDGFSFRQSQISLEARLRLRHTVVLCDILRPAFLWQTATGLLVSLPGFLLVWWAWRALSAAETALYFYATINCAQYLPMAVGVAICLHRLAKLDADVASDNMALRSHAADDSKAKPKRKRHFVPLEYRVEPTTGSATRCGESEVTMRFAALHEQWGRAAPPPPRTPKIEITTV